MREKSCPVHIYMNAATHKVARACPVCVRFVRVEIMKIRSLSNVETIRSLRSFSSRNILCLRAQRSRRTWKLHVSPVSIASDAWKPKGVSNTETWQLCSSLRTLAGYCSTSSETTIIAKAAQREGKRQRTLSSQFPPKRSLGQNFLLDDNIAKSIVDSAGISEGQSVFEIGPGQGALTKFLVDVGAVVVAVEKDDTYAKELVANVSSEKGFADRKGRDNDMKLRVFNDDVLNWLPLTSNDPNLFWAEFESYCSGDRDPAIAHDFKEKAVAIGNIPYNITKPLLQLMLPRSDIFSQVILMLQLETANRLVSASPGDPDYRAFSTFVQYYCHETKILSTIDRSAFNPKPRVDSAVVRFKLKDPSARAFYMNIDDEKNANSHPRSGRGDAMEKKFHGFVRLAFSNRRKMLRKTLSSNFDVKLVEEALADADLKITARPQELDAHDFVRLYQNLLKSSS